MSSDGNPPPRRSFVSAKLRRAAQKSGGPTAKGAAAFRPNARRPLPALSAFDCPLCATRGAVRVDLRATEKCATVRCTHCVAVRPRPRDLPYPFTTPFVPRLENRADVFFRFRELYRGIEHAAGKGADTAAERERRGEEEEEDEEEEEEGREYLEEEGEGEPYSGDGVLALSAAFGAERAEECKSERERGKEEGEREKGGDGDDGEVDVHAFFGESDED